MGKQYPALTQDDISFIQDQKLFFMASASGKEVNLSPKGFDCLHILDANTLLFLDYPGSGNRTARDIKDDGEVTVVFTAFSSQAQIVRLFCKGNLIEKHDTLFHEYFKYFQANKLHIRRIIQLSIYAVENSCGMGVPKMQFQKERSGLKKWVAAQAEDGTLKSYIETHEIPPNLMNLQELPED